MRSKNLTEFATNPKYIPGIYNYCDRWCERCAFTTNCLAYASERKRLAFQPNDLANTKFWQKVSFLFAQETDSDNDQSASAGCAEEEYLQNLSAHPLANAAESYAVSVNNWFTQDFIQLKTSVDMTKTIEELGNQSEELNNALDVIRWYQFFIAVKIVRGLMSRDDEMNENFDLPKDSDGSIKVALIAIDRSLTAWRTVQSVRPDLNASVLMLLIRLECLRLNAEAEFPFARAFIRAGFDESDTELIN